LRTYRAGILGFGFIGKVHAYGYRNLPLFYDPPPLRARIVRVVTSSPESAEKARQTLETDSAGTDYRSVTESPEIDIVHICTPNHLHKDALLSALRHQKHIYCDKPLVANLAEAEEIAAALADYRGTAQMTFQYRFFPATMRAKALIDEGRLGKILGFRACFLHGGSVSPGTPLKWKLSAAGGGGVIADLASHVLDLVDWLLGRIESVSAATQVAYPQRPSPQNPGQMLPVDAEDSVAILARLAGGALGTLEATKLATGTEDELRLEIHGDRGAIRFHGMEPHYLEFHDATAIDQPLGGLLGWNRIAAGQRYPVPATAFPSPRTSIGWLRSHMACLANFLQAVADERPATPGLDQGLRIQRLIHSVRQSAAEGRWVNVEEGR
jgi:predicted dehydrogenase